MEGHVEMEKHVEKYAEDHKEGHVDEHIGGSIVLGNGFRFANPPATSAVSDLQDDRGGSQDASDTDVALENGVCHKPSSAVVRNLKDNKKEEVQSISKTDTVSRSTLSSFSLTHLGHYRDRIRLRTISGCSMHSINSP